MNYYITMNYNTNSIVVPIQNFLDVSPLNQTVDLGTNATFHCANPGLQPEEYFWIRNHTNPTSVPDLSLIGMITRTKFNIPIPIIGI